MDLNDIVPVFTFDWNNNLMIILNDFPTEEVKEDEEES